MMMNGFFIDKLNIVQNHNLVGGLLPEVGREKLFRVDLKTGETTELLTHLKLEGSYSSALIIRCDGSKVEVYGNPSRWGRIDNLYGLATLDDCIAVYNNILDGLGLPRFTKCTKYLYYQGKDGKHVNKTADGAIIKHIDFTRNLSTGLGNERPFLKALSTQSIGRSVSPFLYPDENTVEWYGANVQKKGSTYRYIKVYTKTADLLRNQRKLCRDATEDDFQYFDDLLQFTVTNGVIREEHSFKREYLHRHDLFAYGLFEQNAFNQELQVITELRKRLEVSNMKYETIADQLLNEKICKSRQSANSTQMYYSMWLHGEYMDKTKSQYREHKSRLLKLGIDISQKLDITRAPLRLKASQIIEVNITQPPSWYRHPEIPTLTITPPKPQLRLVA
ncbi:MAG: phage/plasmid replication protein [Methylobacter sp.]|nr:phage/plasmid replication protein [Methylobacter sp.]